MTSDADLVTFEGILTRHAEVRSTPAPDGLHSVPIVYLELLPIDKAGKQDTRTCQAHITYTDATRRQAEACAKVLKKGMVVTVGGSTLRMRLVLRDAQIINPKTEL